MIEVSDLALSPNGVFLVVANQNSDTVSVIDSRSGTVAGDVSAGTTPIGLGQMIQPALFADGLELGDATAWSRTVGG